MRLDCRRQLAVSNAASVPSSVVAIDLTVKRGLCALASRKTGDSALNERRADDQTATPRRAFGRESAMGKPVFITAAGWCVSVAIARTSLAEPPQYTVLDLGPGRANAISDNNMVVGWYAGYAIGWATCLGCRMSE